MWVAVVLSLPQGHARGLFVHGFEDARGDFMNVEGAEEAQLNVGCGGVHQITITATAPAREMKPRITIDNAVVGLRFLIAIPADL